MSFNPFQKFILSVSPYVLVAAASLGAYLWIFNRINVLDADIKDVQAKIMFLGEEKGAVFRMAQLFAERESDIARIKNFFVDPEHVVEFIESMEALARNTGNKISIDFDEAKSAGEIYYFRFTVNGAEKNVLKYLRAVELYPAEIRTQDINFQRPGGAIGDSTRLVINAAVRKLTQK